MALTINSQPTVPASGRNLFTCLRSLLYEVQSNAATIVNIIADVYVNGTYFATEALPVDGNKRATFDVADLVNAELMRGLRDNINFRMPGPTGATVVAGSTFWAPTVQLRFYEETESAGVLTSTWAAGGTGTGSTNSSTINVFPKPAPRQDATVTNAVLESNVMGDPADGLSNFLSQSSNAANPKPVKPGARAYLSAFFGDTSSRVRLEMYDSAGSLVGSAATLYTVSTAGAAVFGVGPLDIDDQLGAGTVSASVDTYRVYCEWDSGGGSWSRNSEYVWWQLDRRCYDYGVMFHHLGLNGGIDSFYVRGEYQQDRVQSGLTAFEPAFDGSTYDTRIHGELALERKGYDEYAVVLPPMNQNEMRFFSNCEYGLMHFADLVDDERRQGTYVLTPERRPYKGSQPLFEDVTLRFRYFDLPYHAF